jgi:predicted nucleic acid-binding protein
VTLLLDSNIIIYSTLPDRGDLRALIASHAPAVSATSIVEVLGYHKLADSERNHFESFFRVADVLPISEAVIDQAVRLRQQRKMTLGDSLIAATAVVHDLELLTRNIDDFSWVPELHVRDPLASP